MKTLQGAYILIEAREMLCTTNKKYPIFFQYDTSVGKTENILKEVKKDIRQFAKRSVYDITVTVLGSDYGFNHHDKKRYTFNSRYSNELEKVVFSIEHRPFQNREYAVKETVQYDSFARFNNALMSDISKQIEELREYYQEEESVL